MTDFLKENLTESAGVELSGVFVKNGYVHCCDDMTWCECTVCGVC